MAMIKRKPGTRKDKIIEILYAEIARKDSIIEELKQKNQILMKTVFKNAEDKIERKKYLKGKL